MYGIINLAIITVLNPLKLVFLLHVVFNNSKLEVYEYIRQFIKTIIGA
jgi:hypothetical protein